MANQKYFYLHLVVSVGEGFKLKKGSVISCPHSQTELTTLNTETGELSQCELVFLKRIPFTEKITKQQGIEIRDIAIAKGYANIRDWSKWIAEIKE
jgi:hypothetical protein